jgi:hypothetical protein
MINNAMPQEKPDSATALKNIFDQSLAVLAEGKVVLTKDTRIGRACRDSTPLHINTAELQKRALEDAARALASLWKISDAGRSKSQGRPTRLDR